MVALSRNGTKSHQDGSAVGLIEVFQPKWSLAQRFVGDGGAARTAYQRLAPKEIIGLHLAGSTLLRMSSLAF